MIEPLLPIVRAGQSFLVAAHEGPDGDAIASTLALANALREMGKDVVAFNCDGVPADFEFLPGQDQVVSSVPTGLSFDVGFVLDAGELKRAGDWIRSACKTLVNLDHHPKSEDFGDIYCVDDRASATGALIYRLLRGLDWPISLDVATCIYTAILSDTGSFRYSNADREAFSVAGEMVDLGVDPWAISSGLYESQDVHRLRLLGMAMSTLTVSPCGTYASITVRTEMYEATGTTAEHTDRFINYPRSIRGVEVAIFFRQVDASQVKVGFRSKGNVDVGSMARELGGGGHHNAAGATLSGSLEQIHPQVFALVDALLAGSR